MDEVTGASIPKLPRGVRLHFDQVRNAHVLLAPERAFNVDGATPAAGELAAIKAEIVTMREALMGALGRGD